MKKTRIALAALLLSGMIAGVAQAGGQATVTILKAPKGVVAGQSFEVAFRMTPNWPMARNRSLEPAVKAVCGEQVVTLASVPLKNGQYKAALIVPSEGEWVITVDSGLCHTKMSPLVLTAAPAKKSQT